MRYQNDLLMRQSMSYGIQTKFLGSFAEYCR